MEKNTKEEEFFDEKEIKKTGKQDEEMDTSFLEPKKHHFFAIFLIFILILLVGGLCTYYFVLNTPKKTYITIVNRISKTSSISNNKDSYNYKINTTIVSNKKDIQNILDVTNKIELSGTTKYNNDILTGNNNIKYKGEELLDIIYSLDLKNNTMYLKLNNILDKIIKINIPKEETTNNININKDDYIKLINSIINNFKLSLDNANYKRTLTKINNSIVFKETLLLDETLSKELLTKLLHDDEFLQTYAKINNITVSEVSDELNNKLSNIDKDISTVSIYKTIINNEILKIELFNEDNSITINKEDNKYNYEIIDDNELVYKGFIKTEKTNNETKEIFDIELLKEKINLVFNITYSKNNNYNNILDTNSSININDLSEEDITKILEYIDNNKTIKSFLDDLGLTEQLNEINNI